MFLFKIIFGVSLLAYGRKLYWLFVGALGFAAAATLTAQYLQGMNEWLLLGIALVIGILGALLAVWMQSFAIGLAGFLGGGQIALSLLLLLGFNPRGWGWIPFLIGAFIGLVFILSFFDWALIIISSLGGASLLTQTLSLSRPMMLLVFIILAVIGISIQSRMMMAEEQ